MNWILIISTIGFLLAGISLLLLEYEHKTLFLQSVYTFIYDHKMWRRYRRLKKYLKDNTMPIIELKDYTGNNAGFAFIQYDDMIFVIQGDNLYLISHYSHLIKDLLKCNNHDS